eukprot:CAMPEP_0179344886 /NCGR_PEP_ID=MMETSP0797-20121207/71746_1 /TAXON_ID=47934 /ORGANISM="Dinophysis acuminata, Strain DAEP01" /LENGTH=232 /DNA_ID=CAMNT_0021059331 /DNA_START=173 /DNA_END=869 /DNA_ORIENTATION=+
MVVCWSVAAAFADLPVIVQPGTKRWNCNNSVVESFTSEGLAERAKHGDQQPGTQNGDVQAEESEDENSDGPHHCLVLPPHHVETPPRAKLADDGAGRVCEEERRQRPDGHLHREPQRDDAQVDGDACVIQVAEAPLRHPRGHQAPGHGQRHHHHGVDVAPHDYVRGVQRQHHQAAPCMARLPGGEVRGEYPLAELWKRSSDVWTRMTAYTLIAMTERRPCTIAAERWAKMQN